MLRSADNLAKAFYSTILADLGVQAGPNILLDEETLQQFTREYGNIGVDWVPAGPANGSYESLKNVTGRPSIKASTISNSYLCQVPVAKVPASMIVAVLLADLVFLRTLWTAVKMASVWVAEKKDPKGMFVHDTCLHQYLMLFAQLTGVSDVKIAGFH
ncbi:gnat family n-acetyltransferase [Neofusicoccum parvum]|nr:gnat family n-acetyltransferase [Neofusicoccum parvum]